jgi:MFS-type transporter involved in bile tolerance (Atg22 family)
MTIGYTLVGVSLLGLMFLRPDTTYWMTALLFLINGIGQGLAIAPANAAVLHIVQPQRAGIASATVNAARYGGTALGIATLGAFAHAQLATPTTIATFTAGMRTAMLVGGIIVLLAAAALAVIIRPTRRSTRDTSPPAPAATASDSARHTTT